MKKKDDDAFDAASKKVEEAHSQAVEDLKTKVAKAKNDALKKLKP